MLALDMAADNIIDLDKLNLRLPRRVSDLPSGASRLLSRHAGERIIVCENDEDGKARPGRLLRRQDAHAH